MGLIGGGPRAVTVGYSCVPPSQNFQGFILKVLGVCQKIPLNIDFGKNPHPWAWNDGLDIQGGHVSAC